MKASARCYFSIPCPGQTLAQTIFCAKLFPDSLLSDHQSDSQEHMLMDIVMEVTRLIQDDAVENIVRKFSAILSGCNV